MGNETMHMGHDIQELFKTNYERFSERFEPLQSKQDMDAYEEQQRRQPMAQFWQDYGRRLELKHADEVVGGLKEKHFSIPVTGQGRFIEEPKEQKLGAKNRVKKHFNRKKSAKKMPELSGNATPQTWMIMHEREVGAKKEVPFSNDYEANLPLKEKILAKKYTHRIFDKDYFGEHSEEVRTEIKELEQFLRVFGADQPAFYTLSPGEQSRARMLENTFSHMHRCYETVLRTHGLMVTEKGVELQNPPGDQEGIQAAYRESMESLEIHLQSDEDQVVEKIKEEVTKNLGHETERIGKEKEAERKLFEKQFPLVSGKYFSLDFYKNIQGYMDSIDEYKNDKRYTENKEIIDALLQDYIKTAQVYSEHAVKNEGYEVLRERIRRSYGKDPEKYSADLKVYQQMVEKDYTELNEKVVNYANQLDDMKLAIDHLLLGEKKIKDSAYVMLLNYGYAPAQHKLGEMKENAVLYAETYRSKQRLLQQAIGRVFPGDKEMLKKYSSGTNGRAIMLMKKGDLDYNVSVVKYLEVRAERDSLLKEKSDSGDSDATFPAQDSLERLDREVGAAAQKLAAPRLQAVIDANLGDLRGLTDEQLIAMQPKIMELIMHGMMVSDMAKEKSDIPGLSIRDKLLGKPDPATEKDDPARYEVAMKMFEGRDKAFSCKMTILEGLKNRARSAAVLSAGANFMENPYKALTLEEEKKVKRLFPNLTPREQVIAFMEREKEVGERFHKTNEQELLKSADVRNYVAFDGITISEAPELSFNYTEEVHHGTEYYHEMESLITERISRLKDAGADKVPSESEMAKILYSEAKAANDTAMMFKLSILVKLKQNSYRLAGDDKGMILEPMFRAFGSSERTSSIRTMPDEKYEAMLADLSAGAFLDKNSDPAEIQEARERNKKGLRTYYDTILTHYEMLEQKYGYENPDPAWLVLHYEEAVRDFSNPQVDCNLIDHDTEVLDRKDKKDLRLIHLVRFYDCFCGVLLYGMGGALKLGNYDMDGMYKQANLMMSESALESKKFLKENPVKGGSVQ